MKKSIISIALFCLCTKVSPAKAQSITEFHVCASDDCAIQIARGPDGNLWFTEAGPGKIGRITTAGTITEFSVPPGLMPNAIVAGADGNLWFTENSYNFNFPQGWIGKATTNGSITEFGLPTTIRYVEGIAWGSDGNLWITDPSDNEIARMTISGAVAEFTIPTPGSYPQEITAGPDGNLWFTENIGNIGRITPSGTIAEFPLPSFNSNPFGITVGPDGALWFAERGAKRIGRITTSGVITELTLAIQGSPTLITTGPDGNLWITEGLPYVARVTPTGAVTEYQLPQLAVPQVTYGITGGLDGNIWFTAFFSFDQFSFASFVGKLALPTAASSIPALDGRGLAALAALLVAVGFFALKRI